METFAKQLIELAIATMDALTECCTFIREPTRNQASAFDPVKIGREGLEPIDMLDFSSIEEHRSELRKEMRGCKASEIMQKVKIT